MIRFINILCLIILLYGCRGCSRSGREIIREENTKNTKELNNPDFAGKDEIQYSFDEVTIDYEKGNLSSMYNALHPAVLLIITSDDQNYMQGSGFIISPNGVCISNYHVFKGTHKNKTRVFVNDVEYKVSEVLYTSDELDCIIFRINSIGQLPFIEIAPSVPDIGESVFAIGNPEGLDKTLSTGIVSQIRKNDKLIQTTTEITHGSSGGPLMNMNGEVVGITTSGYDEANLNFAINIQKIPYQQYVGN